MTCQDSCIIQEKLDTISRMACRVVSNSLGDLEYKLAKSLMKDDRPLAASQNEACQVLHLIELDTFARING